VIREMRSMSFGVRRSYWLLQRTAECSSTLMVSCHPSMSLSANECGCFASHTLRVVCQNFTRRVVIRWTVSARAEFWRTIRPNQWNDIWHRREIGNKMTQNYCLSFSWQTSIFVLWITSFIDDRRSSIVCNMLCLPGIDAGLWVQSLNGTEFDMDQFGKSKVTNRHKTRVVGRIPIWNLSHRRLRRRSRRKEWCWLDQTFCG
jgi:hypothetical protein